MSTLGNLNRAAAAMLSMPSTRAFIDQHRDRPDASAMLMIDTGDGRPGSDEDNRCDGCGTVWADGLRLAIKHLRVTEHGLQVFEAENLLNPGPVVTLVFGICDPCGEELGAAA